MKGKGLDRLKLALIGCGGMSRSHLRRFHLLRDRLELAAAVDADLARAQLVACDFPGIYTSTDYRRVLDLVDAALIVLPHHLHHPVARECLRAGLHVMVEKPMANSEAECLDLIHLADAGDRILMVAYCMRFHPLVIALEEQLGAETCGELFQLSIWTEQLTQRPPDSWMCREATLGGGQLFSHGCHYIDLMLHFLGQPLRGVHMGTNLATPWMEREGTSNVSLAFAGDRLGYHFGTWGARGSRLRYSFHAHCSAGMLEADFSGRRLIAHRGGESRILAQHADSSKHTEAEMVHFIDCIEKGQRPITDGRRSLQSLRVIWKLYDAEKEGREADLRGLGLDAVE
jgi:predicted dehydrogenase